MTFYYDDFMSWQTIAAILKRGGVIIAPTETLYGLMCDAANPRALKKVYRIKNRPAGKAFPILIRDFAMLARYARLTPELKKKLAKIWRGQKPTNVVLMAKNLPQAAMINNTAAFRISSHAKVKELFKYFAKPLIATSANLSGQKPISDPRQYKKIFGGKAKLIDAIIFNGINRKQKGSRIIDLTKPLARRG